MPDDWIQPWIQTDKALMDAYDSFLHLSVAAPVQAFPAFKELGWAFMGFPNAKWLKYITDITVSMMI